MKITIRRVKANQLYTFISCCHLHELPLISFWFDSDFSRSVIQFKFRAEKFTFKQRTIQTPFASLTSILVGSYAYYCNFVLFYILSVFFSSVYFAHADRTTWNEMCQNMCSHGSERAGRLPYVWLYKWVDKFCWFFTDKTI